MRTFIEKFRKQVLRTIIIDDEQGVRKNLEKVLKRHCPHVRLVSEANGVESGVKAIRKYNPDLILLDIKMNDGTGFDLLKQLEPVDFKVIFITAYDQYAIKAIKFSALDYLLKPIDPDDLVEAVKKAEKLVVQELNQQLGTLADNMQTQDVSKKKIILKTFENIHLVKLQDIIFCECLDNYTNFHLINGRQILVSNTLKEYDEILSEFGFFRAHKSYLINLIHIDRFEKSDGGSIVLTNEIKLPVASRKKDQLLEMIHKITEI